MSTYTKEQLEVLQAIAAQMVIAGWQPLPGMLARSHNKTQDAYRYTASGWTPEDGMGASQCTCRDPNDPKYWPIAMKLAAEAGPDLTDDITAIGLLAELPDAWMTRDEQTWYCGSTNHPEVRVQGDSRACAIGRLWLKYRGLQGNQNG